MSSPDLRQGEPRWPAMVALLAVSGLFFALPPALKVGPDWVFLVLVAGLTAPGVLFRSHQFNAGIVDVSSDRLVISGLGADGERFYTEELTVENLTPA